MGFYHRHPGDALGPGSLVLTGWTCKQSKQSHLLLGWASGLGWVLIFFFFGNVTAHFGCWWQRQKCTHPTFPVSSFPDKDNDLRCRVNKRANKMLGNVDSEIKARWIEEEFAKRQWKRKDKERRKNPDGGSMEPMPPPVSSISLSEQIALHQQQQQQHSEHHQQQLAQLQHAFDPKTALALNDLVKTTTSHLDLAQLTGVLTDPDLTRQLLEMNANSSQSQSAASLMVLSAPVKSDDQDKGHVMDADYPMDAVLTLMQLNGSWKA